MPQISVVERHTGEAHAERLGETFHFIRRVGVHVLVVRRARGLRGGQQLLRLQELRDQPVELGILH